MCALIGCGCKVREDVIVQRACRHGEETSTNATRCVSLRFLVEEVAAENA